MTVLIIILTIIIILAGLWGLILSFLPGPPLVWLGIFIYSWYTGFEDVSLTTNLIFLGLVVFSLIFDWVAAAYGAKKMGATKWGMIGGIAGLIIGLSAGFPGLILGPFLGASVFELMMGKETKKAFKAGLGAILGLLGGILLKISISLVMIGIFLWKIWL